MNEKTKVEYMGKRLKVVSTKAKNVVMGILKGVLKVAIVLSVIYAIYFFGKLNGTSTIYKSNVEVKEVIVEVTKKSQVMERIAKCESSTGHYGPSGQVIFNANNNGSVDVGKYQINTVWFKKATELGYDLTVEEDNEAFAMWIYDNRGTEDWYSSKKCWNK
jgi:hypothetical protein